MVYGEARDLHNEAPDTAFRDVYMRQRNLVRKKDGVSISTTTKQNNFDYTTLTQQVAKAKESIGAPRLGEEQQQREHILLVRHHGG